MGRACGKERSLCPGGFEHYFDELAEITSRPDFSPEMIAPVAEKYGIDSIPALCEEHGLNFAPG